MVASLRRTLSALACIFALVTLHAPACAETYPSRPVHFINGFAAGGPVDTVARIMALWRSDRLVQQFIVENRTGSGGNIAAAAVISAPADGYTVLFVGAN